MFPDFHKFYGTDAKLIRCLIAEFDKKVSETPEAFIIHRIKLESECKKCRKKKS